MTPPACITIGNFDGVHLGHQSLINLAAEIAATQKLALVILTFWPHPRAIIAGQKEHLKLMSRQERLGMLGKFAAARVWEMPFTPALATLTPQDFLMRHLLPANLRHLVIGHDFTLGKGRTGNVATLANLADQFGFAVTQAPPFCVNNIPVSSTIIRRLIASGDVENAAELLGRPYAIAGKVEHGFARGRALGFPTANLSGSDQLLPAHGVYAAYALVEGKKYNAVTNIGHNPTFNGQKLSIESFLLDTQMDIYDKYMELQFVKRIRPEKRFNNPAELAAQIQADIRTARFLLA